MKISKVVASDVKTEEKRVYTFGTASDGKRPVTSGGGKLNNYLEFCFKEDVECVKDVEVEFVINNEEFSLSRLHNEDGTTRCVLKKKEDGSWQVVARSKTREYIEELLNEQLEDMLKIDYVNNIAIDNFHGDLNMFDEIRLLASVQQSVARSSEEARKLKENALRKVREYASNMPKKASPEQLDAINNELNAVFRDITAITSELGDLKARKTADGLREDVARELEATQKKYTVLTSRQEEIEEARKKIKLHDDVETLIPKVKTLQAVNEQRADYEKKRYAITTELEWQEKELASIDSQLEEKQRQYALSQDKRNRVESINNELSYVSSLYEKNKSLNEQLLELNEKQQRLSAEKVMYTNKMDELEKSISEVKESLDAFNVPAKSVGELLETVRVDVKIDEVESQIEKLQSEVAVKESQIAEKESNLVVQMKRFRSVAELDVAVTPMKAKDTILQVLDAKFSKLEAINQSLQEKSRNLERALEDYKYRIGQIERSKSKIQAEYEKTLLRKQEEFKREVFLNSQKVFSDDASGVFAVTANFHDQEVEALEQELSARSMDRELLLERSYQLEGALKEIKRHIEINGAEMETLQREKGNINDRYNEIVSQNSNETVFNYLKALNTDGGTKYLLNVQQDAVRSEAELAELKRSTEALRAKATALKSRLKYLKETQQQLDSAQASVDSLVTTNDKVKEELTDIGERLSASYEQYKAVSRQLESIESKLDDVRGAIVEITKTIKVNEAQINESNEKAKKYAGSDDIEQALSTFKYDLGDVESERQMLLDSKAEMEKDVFKKRLEMEKMQWLYESTTKEYDELHRELQFEFNLKGLDVDKVNAQDLESNVDELRKVIADYDSTRNALADKIENLYGILQNRPKDDVPQEEIDKRERQLEELEKRKAELEEQRKAQLDGYVAASAARMRVTAAAAEARTLANLRSTLEHNDLIGLLIRDKINATLVAATQYVNAFTGGSYLLSESGYKVLVKSNGEVTEYDDLPQDIKTAVYVSLMLSVPNTDDSDGKWIIFEERINIDKKLLADMLMSIDNISYVVSVTKE
ncbi:MAG: hypothetical protein NC099_00020 [Corallococcus sp.]|nr:hypothetical protein [Bacillota bacterium]MCM1533023.1 hypothetical protein [Corallococcus sp.]